MNINECMEQFPKNLMVGLFFHDDPCDELFFKDKEEGSYFFVIKKNNKYVLVNFVYVSPEYYYTTDGENFYPGSFDLGFCDDNGQAIHKIFINKNTNYCRCFNFKEVEKAYRNLYNYNGKIYHSEEELENDID